MFCVFHRDLYEVLIKLRDSQYSISYDVLTFTHLASVFRDEKIATLWSKVRVANKHLEVKTVKLRQELCESYY